MKDEKFVYIKRFSLVFIHNNFVLIMSNKNLCFQSTNTKYLFVGVDSIEVSEVQNRNVNHFSALDCSTISNERWKVYIKIFNFVFIHKNFVLIMSNENVCFQSTYTKYLFVGVDSIEVSEAQKRNVTIYSALDC